MADKSIVFGNWWRGIGTSKYDVAYFADLSNADITTEVGTIRCQYALIKESGTTIDKACFRAVAPSGTTYFFSKSDGAIWKRSTSGTYSTVTANTNTTGHLGAHYYNGYIYYATALNLGRFVPDTEGSKNDDFGTFTNADPLYHPMTVKNLTLYVGDGNYVSSVNVSDTFSPNALDLESQHRVTALREYGTDLLICTGISSYVSYSGVFRWDTYSDSWMTEDFINEAIINFIITSDTTDIVFICAGTSGNIYLYDGTHLEYYTTAPNVTTSSNWQLTTAYNRRPLFAVGGKVFSLVNPQRVMAPALNHEYTCSAGSSATIHSITALGTQLLVAWGSGSTYGVDKIDTTARATATFTTPIVSNRKNVDIRIPFDLLPTGTSITLETNLDNAGFLSKTLIRDSADMNMYRLDGHCANHRTIQARVTLTPTGTDTPIVPHIEFV